MTQQKYLFLILGAFSLIFSACFKSEGALEPYVPEDTGGTVKGRIVTPAGSSQDVSTYQVLSPIANASVEGDSFQIEIPKSYAAQFVVNEQDEVVMMGYQYPDGNTDISASSSALGILMTTPVALYLSNEGKKTLIDEILADANFPALVEVIEQMVIAEEPLLDTTNMALRNALQDMEESVFMSPPPPGPNLPVNMFRAGRNVVFNNKGVSFGTVVAMFKDNEKVSEAYVEGVTVVPGSLIDIWAGYGEVSEDNIVEYPFEMQGDGEFTFKFRTGFPGRGDGSSEHDMAFWDNIIDFSYGFIGTFLPVPNYECFNAAKASLAGVLMSTHGISSNSNVGIGSILYAVTDATMGLINSLEECKEIGEKNYFTKVARLFAVATKTFSLAGTGVNTFYFAKDWEKYDAVIDTCFTVAGDEITPNCGMGLVDILEGTWMLTAFSLTGCGIDTELFADPVTGELCEENGPNISECVKQYMTFFDNNTVDITIYEVTRENGIETYSNTINQSYTLESFTTSILSLCQDGICTDYTYDLDGNTGLTLTWDVDDNCTYFWGYSKI